MKDRNKIMRFFGLHPQNDVRRKFAFTFAEGATHVDNSNNKRRFAFTLAEVLVTLGIIGVVAVLTVPNVISSYQKKVYVAKLQKSYSQLQQVFSLAMVDDEVEYLVDTELMQSINGSQIGDSEDQSAFSSKLGEYMKIQKVCQPEDFSDGCHDITYYNFDGSDESHRGGDLQVFANDGMIYYFSYSFSKSPHGVETEEECAALKADGAVTCLFHAWYDRGCSIQIDVNAKKGPNKYGRDMFRFFVDDKGELYPYGSVAAFGKSESWLSNSLYSSCDDGYGVACTARIIDEGWVMDY